MTFPFVRTLVEKGELNLHGAYFGVAEGSLFVLDPAAKEFRGVGARPHPGEWASIAKGERVANQSG